MLNKIVCAGIGGQGVLTLGMILAEASASLGKNVTYIPEYGSEMRGGNAATKIKIDDDPIVWPFMEEMNILAVLHQSQVPKYIDQVEEGGIVFAEEELAADIPEKKGVKVVKVPAGKLAEKAGNPRGMSVVMAGAVIAGTDLFPEDVAVKAVESYFEHKGIPVDANKAAFVEGYKFIKG